MFTIPSFWVIATLTSASSIALAYLVVFRPQHRYPARKAPVINIIEQDTSPKTFDKPFRLLDLPHELRVQIYQSLPSTRDPQQPLPVGQPESNIISPHVPPPLSIPPLAATSRTVRTEVLQTLFSAARLRFHVNPHSLPMVRTWLRAQDELGVAALRHVSFSASFVARVPMGMRGNGTGNLSRVVIRWMAENFHRHVYRVDVRRGVVAMRERGEEEDGGESGCGAECVLARETMGKLEGRLEALGRMESGQRYLDRTALSEMLEIAADGENRHDRDAPLVRLLHDAMVRDALMTL